MIDRAMRRWKYCAEAWEGIYSAALDDKKFQAGEQWNEKVKTDREQAGRPCLVINKLPQFRNQITNDQRQNRSAIKVRPIGDNSDVKKAEAYNALLRHIDVQSDASAARDTAFEDAVDGGIGFYRILTDYCEANYGDEENFEQEIYVAQIDDFTSVYIDPDCKKPDYSDMQYGFICEDMQREDFEKEYPESRIVGWPTDRQTDRDWISKDKVRIVEYFECEKTNRRKIYLIQGGEGDAAPVKVSQKELDLIRQSEGWTDELIINEREIFDKAVTWYKLTALDVLDEKEWPGRYIPIVPVIGEKHSIGGKKMMHGIVRNSKDACQMYNFWVSAETENLALAPLAPWVVAAGQLEGYEAFWREANRKPLPYLPYKPVSHVDGTPVPPPQRDQYAGVPSGIVNAKMGANEDIKATTGIFDASIGNRSNETSGRAILARANQGATANFHYPDNLARAMRYEGKVTLDLIPKIYDTYRIIQISGEDDKDQTVEINKPDIDPMTGQPVIVNDLRVGKYDVVVTTGPAFASRRAEATEAMMEFMRTVPNVAAHVIDLLAKNMDWPGADEIAERLKRTIPPQILGEMEQGADPQQIMAQMQQAMQENEQLKQQMQQINLELEKEKMKGEYQLQEAMIRARTDIQREEIKARANVSIRAQATAPEAMQYSAMQASMGQRDQMPPNAAEPQM